MDMETATLKPADFRTYPWSSFFNNSEHEVVALNTMKILAKNGNEWRKMDLEEYVEARKKDGNYSSIENNYFKDVVDYTKDVESAAKFCSRWNEIAIQ